MEVKVLDTEETSTITWQDINFAQRVKTEEINDLKLIMSYVVLKWPEANLRDGDNLWDVQQFTSTFNLRILSTVPLWKPRHTGDEWRATAVGETGAWISDS